MENDEKSTNFSIKKLFSRRNWSLRCALNFLCLLCRVSLKRLQREKNVIVNTCITSKEQQLFLSPLYWFRLLAWIDETAVREIMKQFIFNFYFNVHYAPEYTWTGQSSKHNRFFLSLLGKHKFFFHLLCSTINYYNCCNKKKSNYVIFTVYAYDETIRAY